MGSITQEQILIGYTFPEKMEEEAWCKQKEPT
jgi:hypothetical protein